MTSLAIRGHTVPGVVTLSLREVLGDFIILQATNLLGAVLPRLVRVRGALRVEGNAALAALRLPALALANVSGRVVISDNAALRVLDVRVGVLAGRSSGAFVQLSRNPSLPCNVYAGVVAAFGEPPCSMISSTACGLRMDDAGAAWDSERACAKPPCTSCDRVCSLTSLARVAALNSACSGRPFTATLSIAIHDASPITVNVTRVEGSLRIAPDSRAPRITFPLLASVDGDVTVRQVAALEQLRLPALQTVGGTVTVSSGCCQCWSCLVRRCKAA